MTQYYYRFQNTIFLACKRVRSSDNDKMAFVAIMYFAELLFKELNSIRFIDLDPGPKQTIREPDPVHEKYNDL